MRATIMFSWGDRHCTYTCVKHDCRLLIKLTNVRMRGQKFHSQMSLARRNGCFRSLTCLLFTVCLQIQTRSNHWFIKWVCEDLTRRYPKKLLFPILFRLKHEPEPSSMNPWHPSTRHPLKTVPVSRVQDCLAKKYHPLNTRPCWCSWVSVLFRFHCIFWHIDAAKNSYLLACQRKKILSPEVWEKHSYKISKPNLRSGVFFSFEASPRLPNKREEGPPDRTFNKITYAPL